VETQDRRILFPRELWTAQAQTAETARLRDPWEDMIPEALRSKRIILQATSAIVAYPIAGFVSTGAILQALNAPGGVPITKRLANVCERLGWVNHKQKIEGQTLRGYLIPAELFDDAKISVTIIPQK
jgi:hypothetical protein